MSLIGKAIGFVAADKVSGVLDKAIQKLEAKSETEANKLFEKEPGTEILVLQQQMYTWTDKFDVYNENQQVKYTVKGKLTSFKRSLDVYDARNKKIGIVKEKLITFRSPFSFRAKPRDFIVELNGNKLGRVRYRASFGKYKYEVSFNKWRIEGNVLSRQYKILKGEEEIANISKKAFHSSDTYVVAFPDSKNEQIILLLVLALDVSRAPKKSEDFRRTMHHKTWL
jgi:uncharacterized protein YxjI